MDTQKTLKISIYTLLFFINIIINTCIFNKKASAQLQCLRPSGGQRLEQSTLFDIKWKNGPTSDGHLVKISLWDGGMATWQVIAINIPASLGIYQWFIPATNTGDRFRIKIEDQETGEFQMTPTYFKVGEARAVTKVSPSQASKNSLMAYPNPAIDKLSVNSDKPIKRITLRNILGTTVLVKESLFSPSKSLIVDLLDIMNGSYYLEAEYTNGDIEKLNIIVSK